MACIKNVLKDDTFFTKNEQKIPKKEQKNLELAMQHSV